VVGADRIAHSEPLYVDNDVHGDTYGPVNYLAYVPFELALPWVGYWDDLPAARGAAIFFDLLVIAGILMLGRRIRPGPQGARLGTAAAFAYAAYPYSLYALATNANDTLPAALMLFAVAATGPGRRGVLLGLATLTKFAPVALFALLADPRGRRRPRSLAAYAAGFAVTAGGLIWLFLPEGGLREFWNTTIGFQLQARSRDPFSIWNLEPSLHWLKTLLSVAVAALAAATFFVPRRKTPAQIAALGAAIVIGVQVLASHWFYPYAVWFTPLVLMAFFSEYRNDAEAGSAANERVQIPVDELRPRQDADQPSSGEVRPERDPALAGAGPGAEHHRDAYR
jgi:hypothetical protein